MGPDIGPTNRRRKDGNKCKAGQHIGHIARICATVLSVLMEGGFNSDSCDTDD